jgi:AP-2 complex subunit mu-1
LKSVTGAVNWRKPNIKYRKNELFIDVIESVNMLLSSKGTPLNSDVSGRVMIKCYLSGMPECKFGLNDKLMMQTEKKRPQGRKGGKEIEIDDTTFHQCVKLGKFDSDRTISFVPPDGEFELMRYRITENIVPPFRLVSPIVRELGKTRLEVQVTVKSVFHNKLVGKNVVVKIPTPKNTAKCKIIVAAGSAKYKAEMSAIVWTIKRFPGDTEYTLSAEVELIATTAETKKWSRPPISLDFQVPMFTASGLHVRFLKVFEKSNYQAIKWVRYITQSGTYAKFGRSPRTMPMTPSRRMIFPR